MINGVRMISIVKITLQDIFKCGLAPVCNAKNQWGFIDKTGKTVLAFQYGYADRFREGIAKVMKGEKWMFIDPTGKVVKEGEEN